MYYYTDKEELEAVKKENAKLIGVLADHIKQLGTTNRKLNELKRAINDHLVFDKEGKAKYITAKPILDLLEDNNGGKK